MNPLKTFPRGGVHPEENKLSAHQPIQDFPMPKQIIVPLGQCLGAPADCIVKKGDRVLTGQLIGTAKGFVSANVHSPATGTVAKVDVVMDHTGYYKPAVFIDREDQDEWIEGYIDTDELITDIKLDSKQIIDKVKECGIVGMGGATFPTHVKLMVPEGKKAEYIIINAAECEPYLTCDFRLLLEKTQEFLVGVKILMKAVNTDKGIIGIEENKMEAIELLEKTINEHRDSIYMYNTNSYETVETIRAYEGLIDIYLPDLKYVDARLSQAFSRAADYFPVAIAAIEEMMRQVGPMVANEAGLAVRGVRIRHLVLPGCVFDTREVLREIKERFGADCPISLMSQYTPIPSCTRKPLDRPLTKREYEAALDCCLSLGFTNVYTQELSSVGASYTPPFSDRVDL